MSVSVRSSVRLCSIYSLRRSFKSLRSSYNGVFNQLLRRSGFRYEVMCRCEPPMTQYGYTLTLQRYNLMMSLLLG